MNWKQQFSSRRRYHLYPYARWYKKHGHLTKIERVQICGVRYRVLFTISAKDAGVFTHD